MFEYQLSENDKALIQQFQQASAAKGFDGPMSLEPTDRGVLAVAELVRQQTILQVFASLGLQGRDAAKLWFDLGSHEVPLTAQDVHAKLSASLMIK